MTSIVSRIKQGVRRFDRVVAEHPKTAVATAVAVGVVVGAQQSRSHWLHDHFTTVADTVGGATVAGLGIEAAVHAAPGVVAQLATTVSMLPAHLETAVIAAALGLGGLAGYAIAERVIRRRRQPETPPAPTTTLPDRLPGMLSRTLMPISGVALGAAVGVGAAALAGITAALPLVLAGAGGLLVGAALGPVVSLQGLSRRWVKAAFYSLIPAGALIGWHVGGFNDAFAGAGYGAFAAACKRGSLAHEIIFGHRG